MTTPIDRADAGATIVAGRYELLQPLGHGAFGRTFLARDRSVDRLLAIKRLDRRDAADWKAHELFEREATVLRSLRHQGIPAVHDLVTDAWDGAPATFLVMDYVEGVSLARIIEEQRQLDPADVVNVFLELLGIIDYLHGRVPPILHRDIKPSNIILRPDGLPSLVDFGSVRRVFLGPEETGSTIAGTYGYMPYEQYMGQATPASDLYALGATFLHLLTGRPPRDFMTGEGRIEVPDALPGDPRLRPILTRLLRPSPAERYASAREVRQALLSSSVALVPAGDRARPAPRVTRDVAVLGPVPREIQGPTKELFKRVAPTTWDYLDTSTKPNEEPGIFDWISVIFFSVLTAGILPMIVIGQARTRRRRLRRFFRDGLPAMAEILGIEMEKFAFDQRLANVSYEFEADGLLRRDVDQVHPMVSARWQAGDRIQILYLPDRDYDSVIISGAR